MFYCILLFLILVILVYKFGTKNHDYFKKLGIDYVKPSFLVGGNYPMYVGQISTPDYLKQMYNTYKNNKLFGYFDFSAPVFIVRDPEIFKRIAVKDFDHFMDHRQTLDEVMDPLIGKSLLSLCGQRWRNMRSTLSPIFTGSKMRQMFELTSECGLQMARHCLNESHKKNEDLVYEMKTLFMRFSTDVIATCAFGIKVDSFQEPDNQFYTTGQKFLELTGILFAFKFISYRIMPKVLRFFDVDLFDKNYKKYFYNLIMGAIKTREEQNIVRPDLLHLLMQAKAGMLRRTDEKDKESFAAVDEVESVSFKVKESMTDDDMVAQCMVFFMAGFDTVSSLLAFTTYELALHPEIQENLFDEINDLNSTLDGKSLSYDNIQGMKYLDMIVSETLRKWPPGIMAERLCNQDYLYEGGDGQTFTIEKGSSVWLPIVAIHNDPQYFPEPDRFDPERFNDENKQNINLSAYLPFGMGPRNCIGSRFALMETKAVLYYLILNFTFEVTDKTQIPLKYGKKPMQAVSEKGIFLRMKKRNEI